jgi:hypothetical protein
MSLKDKLRDLTLGTKKNFRTVEVDIGDGDIVVLKQLSLGERKDVMASSKGADGELDDTKFLINMIIASAQDEKGDKVFGKADFATFMGMPEDGFLAKLSEGILQLMKPVATEGKSLEG